jgi:putative phosphoesterase
LSSSVRLALLADIHGNSLALDAVLDDLRTAGPIDQFVVLGDLIAYGPDPGGVLQRLAELRPAVTVRGNSDRCIVTGQRPRPTVDQVAGDSRLLQRLVEVTASYAWTHGAVATAGWLEWLAGLPLETRLELVGGISMLAVHASPGADDGDGIHSQISEAALRQAISGCDAGLVCVGHTHLPYHFQVDGIGIVNPGAVGLPIGPDVRAGYALVEVAAAQVTVSLRKVAYPNHRVIESVRKLDHPSAEYIAGHHMGREPIPSVPVAQSGPGKANRLQ